MANSRPNVIYILGDDQRAEYLGCAGHPILQTPHLDRLAAEGTRFTHAFCTSPACTPSRASHYLGQWERRHGINFNSGSALDPRAWDNSFPMQLQQAGYFVGWVGKNHVPAGGGRNGYSSGYFEQVFDYWYANHNHSGFYPKEMAPGGSIYAGADADTPLAAARRRFVRLPRCPPPATPSGSFSKRATPACASSPTRRSTRGRSCGMSRRRCACR